MIIIHLVRILLLQTIIKVYTDSAAGTNSREHFIFRPPTNIFQGENVMLYYIFVNAVKR